MKPDQPETPPPADAAARRAVKPVICYPTETLPQPDMALLRAARDTLSEIASVTVPPREARTFRVSAGQFFRIYSIEGPQVGDLNLWNAGDLTERFYSGKTRALHGTHLSTGDRMWSRFRISGQWRQSPTTRSTGTGSTQTAGRCMMSSERAAIPHTHYLLTGGQISPSAAIPT